MKVIWSSLVVVGVLAMAAWSGASAGGQPPATTDDKQDSPAKKPRPKFTVSKETTYALGPLTKDGYFDFVTPLNERLSQGVNPANNANVLLWKAFGPRPEGRPMPATFYKWLGIKPLPEKGAYFLDFYRYLTDELQVLPGQDRMALQDELDTAGARPWKTKDYPIVAAWLKLNEKPLALVVEAGKRTRYYNPLVPSDDKKENYGLIGVLLPGVQKCRELTLTLSARAMLHLGEGRYEEAWQDLLALHRLARHVGSGGTLIEGLVGIAIDHIAAGADMVYLDNAKLTSKQIKDCLSDLQKLPPIPSMADKMDLTERFMMLDSILMIPRSDFDLQTLAGLTGLAIPNFPLGAKKPNLENVDWDPALRAVNKWADRLVAVLSMKDRPERVKQMDQIEAELKKLQDDVLTSGKAARVLFDANATPQEKGQIIGESAICLLMPAVVKVQSAADRNEQLERNLHVGFALVAYQREHGQYPKELAALSPKYLANVPLDYYSGKSLIYRPEEKGFLLYSVGANGKDDEGRWYNDNPPGDDPNVRMPVPPVQK